MHTNAYADSSSAHLPKSFLFISPLLFLAKQNKLRTMKGDSKNQGGYGSIEDRVEEAAASTGASGGFDEGQTYYLRDSSGRRLSFRQALRKYSVVAVPIVAAALIVGGAAWFLLRDFNHLYPGSRGDSSTFTPPTSRGHEPDDIHVSKPTFSTKSSVSGGSSSSSSCSSHEKCANLGLKGYCCPTSQGDLLDCCN